jgi:hypothetical protein
MINCFILCDFENPLSMKYLERSLKSFEPVSDILNITPVQCDTPKTIPIRFQKNEPPIPFYVANDGVDYLRPRFFGGTFCDSPLYQAVMYSHFKLIKRIAEGERLIIMEHDAALINEESLREMIDLYYLDEMMVDVNLFMPGTCMEFYSMSQRFAQLYCEFLLNFGHYHTRTSGPLGVAHMMEYYPEKANLDMSDHMVLMPSKLHPTEDKIVFSTSTHKAQNLEGFEIHPPAVKQFAFVKNNKVLNTNDMEYDVTKNVTAHYNMQSDNKIGREEVPTWQRDFVIIEE